MTGRALPCAWLVVPVGAVTVMLSKVAASVTLNEADRIVLSPAASVSVSAKAWEPGAIPRRPSMLKGQMSLAERFPSSLSITVPVKQTESPE